MWQLSRFSFRKPCRQILSFPCLSRESIYQKKIVELCSIIFLKRFESLEKIIFYFIILFFCGIMSFEDMKTNKIRNHWFYLSYLCIVIFHLIFNSNLIINYFISVILISCCLLPCFYIKNKMGKGDFLFGIFQGLCLFPKQVFLCVFYEIVFVLIFVLFLVLSKRFYKTKKIPFIPFMSMGLILSSLTFTIN